MRRVAKAPAESDSAGATAQPLPFATPADLARIERQVAALQAYIVGEFIPTLDKQISAAEALKITGINSRTTLVAERRRPGSLLRYTQHGRSVAYSLAGCVAYKMARLGRSETMVARLRAFNATRTGEANIRF